LILKWANEAAGNATERNRKEKTVKGPEAKCGKERWYGYTNLMVGAPRGHKGKTRIGGKAEKNGSTN